MIWFKKDISVQHLAVLANNTMSEHLGVEFTELGPDFVSARMPVDQRTRQPYGILHGGASCVLSETLGSIGSALLIDNDKFICVGLEINANHIRSAREGHVTGTARTIHVGNTTHVWDIRIVDDNGKLICVSRLTVAILPKRS